MVFFGKDNEVTRQKWLKDKLCEIPTGSKLLDAGAGELRNKAHCAHLNYVSQDYCQYEGKGDGVGLQTGSWNTSKIDIVSDIANIPEADCSFDAILCSEVLEHLPDPNLAIKEFGRLLKPRGVLIITAPFCSLTHFAPFHFCSGFNRYWYEHHLPLNQFEIVEISPNGDWFAYVAQEIWRIPRMGANYSLSILGLVAFALSIPLLCLLQFLSFLSAGKSSELLTFGWHVVAKRIN